MTRGMILTGFLATLLILVVLGTAALREPSRLVEAAQDQLIEAVTEGTDLFAENCVVCHGAAGEGLGSYPALSNEGVQSMAYEDLFRTIDRGRYGTAMAAYGSDEGGIFTDAEIDSLISMMQYADWNKVEQRVADLGLTPPPIEVVEVPEEMVALVSTLPDGDALSSGLTLYAENCVACHGSNAEGTTLAPALGSDELRTRLTDDDLARIIAQGVPGTLMASWDLALSDENIDQLVMLIRRWDELDTAGISLPEVEVAAVEMSPQAIANGEWLYSLLCAQCHGTDGYGSPLAPALNNQLFLAQTPDAAIQQIIAMGVSGTVMPAWSGRLTEADIMSLTAYIRSWEPNAPAIVNPASVGGVGAPAN